MECVAIESKLSTFIAKKILNMKIKHSILFIVFLLSFSSEVFSQDNFAQGTNLINLGIGLGSLYYRGLGGANFSTSPAITLSLDHGFRKIEEIEGTIGLGGIIGFQSSSARYNNSSGFYKYHWSNFIIAPRGTYHAGFLNTDKFDLYGGLMLGLRIETVNFSSNYGAADLGNYGGVNVAWGAFIGGAYYFASSVGAFAELGYDVAYLKIGVSFKPGGK